VVKVWSLGNDYIVGPSTANTGGVANFTAGAILPDLNNRPPQLINDASSSAWSSRWYHFQMKPQHQDIGASTFLNAKDYGVKGIPENPEPAKLLVVTLTPEIQQETVSQMTPRHSRQYWVSVCILIPG
jgi:hypothetical protein